MAGYDQIKGMSNNAVDAYRRGLVPASKIKQVPNELIRQFVMEQEWHHTSKYFRCTDMYCKEEVLAVFGIKRSSVYEANPEAIKALREYKHPKPDTEITEHKKCTVKWLEWGKRGRAPKERQASACVVVVKGQTATVKLPNGQTFKKRLNTNGFSFKAEP